MRLGKEQATSDKTHCLCCARLLDGCTVIDDEDSKPKDGDVTTCVYCGHIMMFNGDLTLRNPTPEEWEQISNDPRLIASVEALSRLHKYKQ